MKQITPNSQTLEAIINGATSILWVIDNNDDWINKYHLQLQTDDEFYIAEEFFYEQDFDPLAGENGYGEIGDKYIVYKDDVDFNNTTLTIQYADWQPASEMTAEQSRYKGKVLSVEVKRVQELNVLEMNNLNPKDYYKDAIMTYHELEYIFKCWLKEQDIDYNENQLVGLINFKEMT